MIACSDCATENTDDSLFCKRCGLRLELASAEVGDEATTAVPPVHRLTPGTIVDQRYRTSELIGEGGMGVVYRALDLTTDEAVAIKLLRSLLHGAGGSHARFQREIEIAKSLDHDHLVKVLDSGVWRSSSYFVMELVEGDSLRDRVRRRPRATPEDLLALIRQLCRGIHAMHEHGVVHRDLKPSNVLITTEGVVKICDFGLALTEGVGLTRLTRTGASLGTPEYMAPEQIEGRRVDTRADIYSLGVVMYEAFTGELPFVGDSAGSIMMQHLNRAPLPPSSADPSVPVWLERIILRALEKDPARRFQSVEEIQSKLEPSTSGRRTERHPRTGDMVILRDPEEGPVLTICAQNERVKWTPSMALRFDERFYKLGGTSVAGSSTHPFVYDFDAWPEGEILRGFTDYEESAPDPPKRWNPLRGFLKR